MNAPPIPQQLALFAEPSPTPTPTPTYTPQVALVPKKHKAALPPLVVPVQPVLPYHERILMDRKVARLFIGDALVNGVERLEYVSLVTGGLPQMRLYRRDRIVGVAYVRSDPAEMKAALVSVLWDRGWTDDCRIEVDAALRRRRTQRKMAKAG